MKRRNFIKILSLFFMSPLAFLKTEPVAMSAYTVTTRRLKATWTKELDNDIKSIYAEERDKWPN